jgi:hypothetical protein
MGRPQLPRPHLRHAVIATRAAVALLAAAIGLTWFAPPVPKAASSSVRILVHGKVITELAGDSVTLKRCHRETDRAAARSRNHLSQPGTAGSAA